MRESAVESAIVTYAEKQLGCVTLKLNGHGNRGKADRWFGFQGRSLFLEIKRPGEKPEPIQEWWSRKMHSKGFTSAWCDNAEDGKRLVREFAENKKPHEIQH
jgi:hypothetical protein